MGCPRTAECSANCSELDLNYLEFDDSSLVVIEIAVVRCREDGDDRWKLLSPRPLVHLEALRLSLMGSDYRQYLVLLEELLG